MRIGPKGLCGARGTLACADRRPAYMLVRFFLSSYRYLNDHLTLYLHKALEVYDVVYITDQSSTVKVSAQAPQKFRRCGRTS